MLESLPLIRECYEKSSKSPLLKRFLREATDISQQEAAKIGQDASKAFFDSDNLLTLAEENSKLQYPDEIIRSIVMCVVRIAELIL